MNSKLFFLVLLAFVSSVTVPELQFDVETDADETTNSFEIPYSSEIKSMILYVYHDNSQTISVSIETSKETSTMLVISPGTGMILSFKDNKSITFTISFPSTTNKKAKVLLKDIAKEINIDLTKKYELPFAYAMFMEKTEIGNITYSVQKLSKDVSFSFRYEQSFTYQGNTIRFNNPFKICNGNDCQEGVTSYDFKKGQTYKIYIKLTSSYMFFYLYGFPKISFYEKKCQGQFVFLPNDICVDQCNKTTYVIQYGNECGSCKEMNVTFPYKILKETICRKTKPTNSYYYDQSNYLLDYCHSSCSSCDGPTENNCLSCSIGTLINKKCYYENCPTGYYKKTGGCGKCYKNCLACDGEGTTTNNHCTACDKTSSYSILVKAEGFGSNCVNKCPDKTILERETKTCIKVKEEEKEEEKEGEKEEEKEGENEGETGKNEEKNEEKKEIKNTENNKYLFIIISVSVVVFIIILVVAILEWRKGRSNKSIKNKENLRELGPFED